MSSHDLKDYLIKKKKKKTETQDIKIIIMYLYVLYSYLVFLISILNNRTVFLNITNHQDSSLVQWIHVPANTILL